MGLLKIENFGCNPSVGWFPNLGIHHGPNCQKSETGNTKRVTSWCSKQEWNILEVMRSSADVVGWVELFEDENSEITIFILKNKENTIRLPL